MRVLITGGAGFIGSHLCDRFIKEGHEVLCVDNFFTGCRKNIRHLLPHPDFEMMRHDITLPLYVEMDLILNFACPASPVHYQHDPVQTVKTSVHGAINMLGLAKRTGAGILQASTSEVYGDPQVHPQTEDYVGHVNPIGLRSCYDEGKRCAETLCFDYKRQHNVDVKVVRIFNTYGPRMHAYDGRVVSTFFRQALSGEPLTIFGSGRQTRSFCYIDDLVDIIFQVAMAGCEYCGPYNIGNPEEVAVGVLAEKILEVTDSASVIRHEKLPADDPERRKPDISKVSKYFNWHPGVNLEDGLIKMANQDLSE